MDSSLSELIKSGATIITPTQRLSRHLRYQYANDRINEGKQAWQTPDCLPWTAWCKRSFDLLSLQIADKKTLLSRFQQQWLWQEVINQSEYKDKLLQVTATAKQAEQAYQLCKAWDIPIFPDDVYLSKDAYAFKKWANAYEKRKQEQNWIDDACLPDYITANIHELEILQTTIVFLGFEHLTQQQLKLIDKLKQQGVSVVVPDMVKRNESVYISAHDDKQAEIHAAACWAKKQLEKNPQANIGVIAPNLSAIRAQVEYGFSSVLSPDRWLNQENTVKKVYSISLGKPLSSYPLIHTALILLALGKRKLSINSLGTLLHSPFITAASTESAERSKFYVALRRMGEQQLSFKNIYWAAEHRCEDFEQCSIFIQLLKDFEISFLSHARQQTLRQWAIIFSEWLNLFGWPGETGVDSDEHQTITAWQSALTQLASLDNISEQVSFHSALFQLSRLLNETRFQPETSETPIQVLGITAAAEMQFDHLWLLDMRDDSWPILEQTNSFIPFSCLRTFNVPVASAEKQLELAKQTTEKLIQSAKEVVFSYAKQEGDRLCRPSPLIRGELFTRHEECTDYKDVILSSAKLDPFIDTNAPPIKSGQLARGGSSLFRDQSACPFKAFARHRLYAESLATTEIGLSPAERGNLLHRAMQFLWQRLKTFENLQYRSESELAKLIHSSVQESLKQQLVQQPETFTDRFTELEQQRLQQLLMQWLLIEKERAPFKVTATEEWQTIVFEDIELHLRVDRVDELADGRCVILDYKTGSVSKNDWETDNPNDPQLPLYAITSEKEVAAIAFASLRPGKLGFVGQAADEDLLPRIKIDADLAWADKLHNWEQVLIKLATDFRQGNAIVDPSPIACRYCDLHALCRIHERIETTGEEE